MSSPTVYVALQQFCEQDDRPRKLLREAGFNLKENSLGRRPRKEELPELLREADAVIAGVEPYGAEMLSALPRLKCISRCGAGNEAIDLETARRRNIAVFTTPDETTEPVAQMAVAMILALARNLPLHLRDFTQGSWKKHTGVLLSEWTVGLVGFGRIGRAVAKHLQPFGPKILAADPALASAPLPSGVEGRSFQDLLVQSDLISLHANRHPSEGPLLGPEEFRRMKPGCRVVNTARGHLIDEAALLAALKAGQISAAALDVFQEEPYTGPLAQLPQVLLTPHVSTLTTASRAAMELRSAQNVVEFFSREDR